MVQTGRAGLGWSDPPILWSKASRKERKDLVVAEATMIEQDELRGKSVAQGQQGRWTTLEGVASRAINWAEFWKLPQARLSFLIRATYDTLPSPKNLHQWLVTEQSCDLCGTINASLQHVLSGCKTALTQGWLRWRHDQVLRKLAEVLEKSRQDENNQSPSESQCRIHFLRQGKPAMHTTKRPTAKLLTPGAVWKMEVDLGRQLQFPQEICSTTLRPDVVLWSAAVRSAMLGFVFCLFGFMICLSMVISTCCLAISLALCTRVPLLRQCVYVYSEFTLLVSTSRLRLLPVYRSLVNGKWTAFI